MKVNKNNKEFRHMKSLHKKMLVADGNNQELEAYKGQKKRCAFFSEYQKMYIKLGKK